MFSINNLPNWFTLLVLLLPLLLSIITNKLKAKTKKLPPGPPKLPIIGNLHQLLGGLPHRILCQLSKKYGPVMLIQLGGLPIVVISSSQAAEMVLKTHEAKCCCRPHVMGGQRITYNYGDLVFSRYNDYYKELRKICNVELFSNQRVQSFRFVREEEVGFLIDSITQSCNHATPVDLSEKLLAFSGNLFCRIAFGKSTRGFNYQVIWDALQMMGTVSASAFLPYFGWIIDLFRRLDKKHQRVFHELDSFCQKLIDDRVSVKSHKQNHEEDIIDVLLKIQRNQGGFDHAIQLKDEQVKALIVDLFLGGVDTTPTTMIWAMSELARNPNIMKKAQEEIRNCVGNKGKVSESDVDKLQYLKAIVKETLRLYPPGPIIPREAMSQFNIDGYNIYPKTQIHINIWTIGRDPKIWERPEEFNPERFLGSSIDYKGNHFEFLPFGSGRRICPGVLMAEKNIELALANLLYCFDWKLPSGVKVEDINMEEEPGLTTHKKTPLKLCASQSKLS